MRYLGVDYGKTKIGLAVSEGQIASPLEVLKITGLKDALAKMLSVIKREKITRIVIGVSESGESKKMTESFIKELRAKLEKELVEIILADETLSSVDGKKLMLEIGSGKNARNVEDAYSAVIILQQFLNSLS